MAREKITGAVLVNLLRDQELPAEGTADSGVAGVAGPHRLLKRLARGQLQNVRFDAARQLVEAYGFKLQRIRGSHYTYSHSACPLLWSLQEVRGEAKAYQLRQFLRLVERYDLTPAEPP